MDREEITGLCNSYAHATGIPAFVIDSKGNPVERKGICFPRFCRIIQQEYGKAGECRRAHLYGSYQAERFGEAYIFFCPFGLVHWVAPIIDGNQVAYSLVAGPVLMSSAEDALITEILLKNGLTCKDIDVLYECARAITYRPPHAVNHLARLLFAVSSHLSSFPRVSPLADRKAFFRQQSSISQILQEMKQRDSADKSYPLAKERELLRHIRLGDKPGAQRVLNEIFGYIFFSQGNSMEAIKTRVTELVVLLSRAAVEGGGDCELTFGLNCNYLQEIERLNTVDQMAYWLSKVMRRFTDCVFNLTGVKNVDTIYRAVAYLREHYMENVTLEKVAGEVNLSPSYFSKLFKEEMKCNFRAYLNKLRIENSKRYLLDESIPLVQVAGMAGFQDQSYFSKVFKKIEGVTPGEFRRTRGLKEAGEGGKKMNNY